MTPNPYEAPQPPEHRRPSFALIAAYIGLGLVALALATLVVCTIGLR